METDEGRRPDAAASEDEQDVELHGRRRDIEPAAADDDAGAPELERRDKI